MKKILGNTGILFVGIFALMIPFSFKMIISRRGNRWFPRREIIIFTKKYSRAALEECAKRALMSEWSTYTFVKNTIGAVAEELGADGDTIPTKAKSGTKAPM